MNDFTTDRDPGDETSTGVELIRQMLYSAMFQLRMNLLNLEKLGVLREPDEPGEA